MGEKKSRQRPALTEAERMQRLAEVSFEDVYDTVFEMQKTMLEREGGVPHSLCGLDFDGGAIKAIGNLTVKRKEDVSHLLPTMLEQWPMVVHVFEAWMAPDASSAPSAHPRRQDIVAIALHTTDVVAAANCLVNPIGPSLTKAQLLYPDRVEGSMRQFERPRMN